MRYDGTSLARATATREDVEHIRAAEPQDARAYAIWSPLMQRITATVTFPDGTKTEGRGRTYREAFDAAMRPEIVGLLNG